MTEGIYVIDNDDVMLHEVAASIEGRLIIIRGEPFSRWYKPLFWIPQLRAQ